MTDWVNPFCIGLLNLRELAFWEFDLFFIGGFHYIAYVYSENEIFTLLNDDLSRIIVEQ